MVIFLALGMLGTHALRRSSRLSFPSSTSCITTAVTKVLVMLAIENTVLPSTGVSDLTMRSPVTPDHDEPSSSSTAMEIPATPARFAVLSRIFWSVASTSAVSGPLDAGSLVAGALAEECGDATEGSAESVAVAGAVGGPFVGVPSAGG